MGRNNLIGAALLALLMTNQASAQEADPEKAAVPSAGAAQAAVPEKAPEPSTSVKGTAAPSGRITAPPLAEMSEAQLAEYERSTKAFGAPLGPRIPLLNSPDVLTAWSEMQNALTKSALPHKLREVAILAVARTWKSEFLWYVHAEEARKDGISPAAVEAIRGGKKPVFTTPDEDVVYRYAHELSTTHQVSDSAYNAAWKLLGTRSLVDLTVLLGHYTSVSMTLNAHRLPLPDGVAPIF